MRRGLVCVFVLLTLVPAARAAPPSVVASASPDSGAAPLTSVLTATGDAASYRWDLGDGSQADGKSVEHVYAAGRWTATVTASSASGETATAQVTITASGVTLTAPTRARFGRRAVFRGSLVPPQTGVPVVVAGPRCGTVARGRTRSGGTFLLRGVVRAPGGYVASGAGAQSSPLTLEVVPELRTGLVGSGARGGRFFLAASVRPAGAGTLDVTITRSGKTLVDRSFGPRVRVKLDTRRLVSYRIHVEVAPAEGYTSAVHVLAARVVLPSLALGAHGASVSQLAARLRQLHYAAPDTVSFDWRLLDSVYAFQKVQGLARTGSVGPGFWRRLDAPLVPRPRYSQPADHIEVNKARQVLYLVRGGRIALIVPVSTAGLPGKFTPVGRFAIYRKVNGFDPSPLGTLYDPMYFTGGYAIHGNPSVPPYPASHGCIRVPMWVAPYLYETNPYGTTVYVY